MLFAGILLRSLLNQHVHFLLTNFNTVALADLGKQQSKAYTANGYVTIVVLFRFHFLLSSFGIILARSFLFQLCPNLFKLGFDHRWRHFKAMFRSQLIEQLTFHIGARQTVKLLLNLTLHQLAQLIDAFQPKSFGERVIGLCFNRLFDFANRDIKCRGLALQIFCVVIVGECYVDDGFILGFQANQLILETGD